MTETSIKNKARSDGQMSGLSAEFFVAAELLKRRIQTSVTFGNAKAIDLLAHNGSTGKTFSVQVKALRKRNYFLIKPADVKSEHVYVFVLLNRPGVSVEYFIVPGTVLVQNEPSFDKYFATLYECRESPGTRLFWQNSEITGTSSTKRDLVFLLFLRFPRSSIFRHFWVYFL